MNKLGIASLALVMMLALVPATVSAQEELPFRTPDAVPLGATVTYVVPGVPIGLDQRDGNAEMSNVETVGVVSSVDVTCLSGAVICRGFIVSA